MEPIMNTLDTLKSKLSEHTESLDNSIGSKGLKPEDCQQVNTRNIFQQINPAIMSAQEDDMPCSEALIDSMFNEHHQNYMCTTHNAFHQLCLTNNWQMVEKYDNKALQATLGNEFSITLYPKFKSEVIEFVISKLGVNNEYTTCAQDIKRLTPAGTASRAMELLWGEYTNEELSFIDNFITKVCVVLMEPV